MILVQAGRVGSIPSRNWFQYSSEAQLQEAIDAGDFEPVEILRVMYVGTPFIKEFTISHKLVPVEETAR
jgi:hypothetical protein